MLEYYRKITWRYQVWAFHYHREEVPSPGREAKEWHQFWLDLIAEIDYLLNMEYLRHGSCDGRAAPFSSSGD